MRNLRRLLLVSAVVALLVLAIPASSFGQATRTWVSGVGDDANPCSRTAPCKTFAGAISKTAAGGEMNCLDPGGFGAVTITKSLAIKCQYTEGGVLASAGNAIVINAAATDKVTLRGLDINGVGTGAYAALVGIKVLSAKSVHIVDNEIARFQAGITVAPTSAATRVLARNNHIHDNGIGVINAPGNNLITFTTVTLRHNEISDNTCGAVVSAFGTNASTPVAATNCGTGSPTSGINRTAVISAFHNGFHDNTGATGLFGASGVFSRGAAATFEMGHNEVTGNTNGLNRPDGGIIRSFSNNIVSNNGATQTPNATAGLSRSGYKPRRKNRRRM